MKMVNVKEQEKMAEGTEEKVSNENSTDRVSNKKDTEPESPIDEAKRILKETKDMHEKIKAERERLEKIESNRLLSGTAGGHVEPRVENPAQKMADEISKAFR